MRSSYLDSPPLQGMPSHSGHDDPEAFGFLLSQTHPSQPSYHESQDAQVSPGTHSLTVGRRRKRRNAWPALGDSAARCLSRNCW